jgi:hypothetical protein
MRDPRPKPSPPPKGYRPVDPAKDSPKRWDDLVWSDGPVSRWLQVTCEIDADVGPFYSGEHYARRI